MNYTVHSLPTVTPLLDLSNNLPKGPLLNLLTTAPLTPLRMRVPSGHSALLLISSI